MKKKYRFHAFILISALVLHVNGQEYRQLIRLNGIVDFEQTEDAFPPEKFTRKIPVPGLIDLAEPKIEQHDQYFKGTHKPRYSWYRFSFEVSEELKGRYAVLKILKSRYASQIIINGHDAGHFQQNNTPIECNLTPFLNYHSSNTLLLRLGDRAWMSYAAATGFDREKFTDIPGIWDDVSIEFTGPVAVRRALILPQLKDSSITAKILLENYAEVLERNMEYALIEYRLSLFIREKNSGKQVSENLVYSDKIQCRQEQYLEFELPLEGVKAWAPDHPFLYEAVVSVESTGKYFDNYGNPESLMPANDYPWIGGSDSRVFSFGMRSFESAGKTFELNGEEFRFFGSAITLNRFFEDPARKALPWDKEWVEKFLVKIPKALGWNYFRVCIGLLPDFWYDLADEHGFLIQNEYPMWNLRGRPAGFRAEYTDWIWSDGNHPSIVIWDALNEQKQNYIGNTLIPELKALDPTRAWDAGWMSEEELSGKEMVEYHWYEVGHGWWRTNENVKKTREDYVFGSLSVPFKRLEAMYKLNDPIILNEFGWLWQNRDGLTSSIRTFGNFKDSDSTPYKVNYEYFEPDGSQLYEDRDIYEYYLGPTAAAEDRWDFQAYLLAIETETLRATRQISGLASFTYLANNGGYVGDWFKSPVKDLIPTQALLVQHHSMREFAAFVDLEDGRYNRQPKIYAGGEELRLNILLVNDSRSEKRGNLVIKILDDHKRETLVADMEVELEKFWQRNIPVSIPLPENPGGYAIVSELSEEASKKLPQKSIRYINVGKDPVDTYPRSEYELPLCWPVDSKSGTEIVN